MTEQLIEPQTTDYEWFEFPEHLPILPIRDVVVFPYMVVPLFVSRPLSMAAVERAMGGSQLLFLTAQLAPTVDLPGASDIHLIGTLGKVLRVRPDRDSQVKVLVQGLCRARCCEVSETAPSLFGRIAPIPDDARGDGEAEAKGRIREVRALLRELSDVGRRFPEEVMSVFLTLDDAGPLADLIAANLGLKVPEAQTVLETDSVLTRLTLVHDMLSKELEIAQWQQRIQKRAKEEMSRTQREYFLREQLKQIRQELGEYHDARDELDEFARRVSQAELPSEASREATKQLHRLEQMNAESSEAALVRTYLDCLLELPWHRETEDETDLARAAGVLDVDHYGLESVKERILEYLGVIRLRRDHRGPVLCFVGPPGVGKTSLGRSIARALRREFVRISLGGVRDESEVRGHRRTYVGAMPGRVLAAMKQAGTKNPVVVLDEIDKLAHDSRGDPASALLEVLDPEQNAAFRDHYINLPFDLSRTIWVATANLAESIPAPLRDRMEVITLPGYYLDEKIAIAERYLVPRQLSACGLSPSDLAITKAALARIVEEYTLEAGVRELERVLGRIARKCARRIAEGNARAFRVTHKNLERYLGRPRRSRTELEDADAVGFATGLAWTEAGGGVLHIEATSMPGRAQLTLTGQLGKVMRESAQAALSCARSKAGTLGIDASQFVNREFHVHVPQGAIPKDGPSAGITMATALISLLTDVPIRRDVAMTGEITLRGRILPVGGIREKLLAAARAGIREVLIPTDNGGDLAEVPAAVRAALTIHLVGRLEDALLHALARA